MQKKLIILLLVIGGLILLRAGIMSTFYFSALIVENQTIYDFEREATRDIDVLSPEAHRQFKRVYPNG